MNTVVTCEALDEWKPHVAAPLFPFTPTNVKKRLPRRKSRDLKNTDSGNFPVLVPKNKVTVTRECTLLSSSVYQKEQHLQNLILESQLKADCISSQNQISEQVHSNDEVKTCNIRNINDSILPRPCLHYGETTYDIIPINSNTRPDVITPKHTAPQSSDARYFTPAKGIWKSRICTPGEKELKKHNETWSVNEQEPQQSITKLSIDQIPRSKTPLNIDDPDRLNMRTVAEFLQTKAKKNLKQNVYLDKGTLMSEDHHQRPRSENTPGQTSSLQTRDYHSLSARSIPISVRVHHKSSRSARPDVTSGSKGKQKVTFQDNMREFKLHRFLDITPCAVPRVSDRSPEHTNDLYNVTLRESVECARPSVPSSRKSKSQHASFRARTDLRYDKPRTFVPERKSYRVTWSGKGESRWQPEVQDTDFDRSNAIRIPVTNYSLEEERSFVSETRANSALSVRQYLRQDSLNSSRSKQNDISRSSSRNKILQSETRDETVTRPPDCVKLSLRQERNATKDKTYLTDLCRNPEA